MMLNPSPLGQMALSAALCGPIAQHFALRPSLRDVAVQVVEQQWRERLIQGPAPSTLTLYRAISPQRWRLDSLADALIGRYCQASNLNLTTGVDVLSTDVATNTPRNADVDLFEVQTLLNECGPFLLDEYKRALTDFWSTRGDRPNSPWAWLVNYLYTQFVSACDLELAAGTLDAVEAATAKSMAAFPEAAQRAEFENLRDSGVWLLNFDAAVSQQLEPEMASALLIERPMPEQYRTVVLVYTLAGKLHRFDSRDALIKALLSGRQPHVPFRLNLHKAAGSMFQAQVAMLFEQVLQLVERIAREGHGTTPDLVESLVQNMDEATSLIEICAVNQHQTRALYQSQLPQWLQQASIVNRRAYASGLIQLAGAQRRSGGKSFLYEIPGIIEYANEAIHTAILADYPQASRLNLDEVEVVNAQVSAVGVGSGGSLFPAGSVNEVRLSLAQLALENVSALRAGKVTVHLRNGETVPEWLTRSYLETLVQRLDVGKAYPDMLRQKLIDDAPARAARQALFVDQVREQLPLLALEKYLRNTDSISSRGVKLVQEVVAAVPGAATQARIRTLSFLRSKGATPDVALNAYLIDAFEDSSGPCVLYRPLHRQPLREFPSNQALFEALCDAGELQDDVLARLDEHVRPIYARGGFEQPHIVRFLPGSEFTPIEVPASATLGEVAISGNILEQLYLSSAREWVARAEAQSVSNSENRWIAYKELGWLMFNTLLPFFNGPVTVSAWMVQLFSSLQGDLQQPPNQDQGERLAVLLFNVASILFAFRTEPPLLGLVARPLETNEVKSPLHTVDAATESVMSSPSCTVLNGLDFSWSSVKQRLSTAQRDALAALKADWSVEQLGQSLPHGARKGLYLHADRLWARVEGSVYEVILTEEGARVVGSEGQLGPWLWQITPGVWAFDLGMRLRGGMPLNRRIEQLREANRQQVAVLDQTLAGLSIERKAARAQFESDAIEMGHSERPSAQSLQRFGGHLHAHCQRLMKIDENYKTLNQLKAQPNFNRARAATLNELAETRVQLIRVRRFQFANSVKLMHSLRQIERPEGTELDPEQHKRFMEQCKHSKMIVDDVQAEIELYRVTTKQLGGLMPMGPQMVIQTDLELAGEPSIRSWQSTELSMQGALILDADSGSGGEQLFDTVISTRVALEMQGTVENDDALTEQERIDVLDNSVRTYAIALEGARNFQSGLIGDEAKPLVEEYVRRLQSILLEAEGELASRIRAMTIEKASVMPVLNRKHVVIKTRNRGAVVGQRRQRAGGNKETVVVLDPIENSELARYEETSEPGVWQPVAAGQVKAATRRASLPSLLKRVGKLLGGADRQMQQARSQARSATIGVEMEEILVRQAHPLEGLAQDIEEALTVQNEVDTATDGHDAAIEAKALSDKATEMRELGRTLHISITKAQPPTVNRVVYLKEQGQISITRPKGRVPSAKRKGQPQDYLQEYVISDKAGHALWYAHFHYPSPEAVGSDFTAAHLKTREQRFEGGQYQVKTEQNSQLVIQIYRSRIDPASADALFLNL